MNKLEVVKFLIEEIIAERELFKSYDADILQANKQAKEHNDKWSYCYKEYEGRNPSKARIKDNCKKIRQIILDISKEVSNE